MVRLVRHDTTEMPMSRLDTLRDNALTTALMSRAAYYSMVKLREDSDLTPVRMVEHWAQQQPNGLAITGPDGSYTYRGLDASANAAAHVATAAAATPPAGFDSVAFSSLLYIQGESNDATEANAAANELFGDSVATLVGASFPMGFDRAGMQAAQVLLGSARAGRAATDAPIPAFNAAHA